jgi:hypothetical protein
MDIEYMTSLFHRTHYEFFYRTLPTNLRVPFMHNEVVRAAMEGTGNQFLVGFWRATAKNICGLSIEHQMPAEVDLTRDDFTMSVFKPRTGTTLLLMTGPAPRGAVEAGCAVAVFEDSDSTESLRYFTAESPADPSGPWMVGEWHASGSRGNLGALANISGQGMYEFVVQGLGLSS